VREKSGGLKNLSENSKFATSAAEAALIELRVTARLKPCPDEKNWFPHILLNPVISAARKRTTKGEAIHGALKRSSPA